MLSSSFRATRNRILRGFAVAVFFFGAACSSYGEDEVGAGSVTSVQEVVSERPIVYRRIYVPANDPKSWPLELEKYLPIEAKEFTALVSATSARAAAQATASVDSAEYRGSLDADGMLRGHGKWTINTQSNETVLIPIPIFSLTITNARWSEFQDQPVQFGVWGSDHGAPIEWGLMVPRTGTLEFDWAVRPQMQSDGLECAWHVPPATTNRIILELPAGQEPSLSGGVVSGTAQAEADSQKTKETSRQWTIEFPTLRDTTLQIVSQGSKKRKPRDQGEVRELTEYRVQERGLDIRLNWDVSLGSARQKELTVPLPRGVQVARVLLDGREGTWHLERGDKRSADKAIINLAPASEKRSLKIEVTAW